MCLRHVYSFELAVCFIRVSIFLSSPRRSLSWNRSVSALGWWYAVVVWYSPLFPKTGGLNPMVKPSQRQEPPDKICVLQRVASRGPSSSVNIIGNVFWKYCNPFKREKCVTWIASEKAERAWHFTVQKILMNLHPRRQSSSSRAGEQEGRAVLQGCKNSTQNVPGIGTTWDNLIS